MLLCCVTDGESDWIVWSCADHQDRAWLAAGADEHVVSRGWAVEIVPLPQLSLLFFNDQRARSRQYEEAFLGSF